MDRLTSWMDRQIDCMDGQTDGHRWTVWMDRQIDCMDGQIDELYVWTD